MKRKHLKMIIVLALCMSVFCIFCVSAFATDNSGTESAIISTLSPQVIQAFKTAKVVGMALCAVSLSVAAVQLLLTSGGSKAEVRDASSLIKQMKWSIIAFAILLTLSAFIRIGKDVGQQNAWSPDPTQWGQSAPSGALDGATEDAGGT